MERFALPYHLQGVGTSSMSSRLFIVAYGRISDSPDQSGTCQVGGVQLPFSSTSLPRILDYDQGFDIHGQLGCRSGWMSLKYVASGT